MKLFPLLYFILLVLHDIYDITVYDCKLYNAATLRFGTEAKLACMLQFIVNNDNIELHAPH